MGKKLNKKSSVWRTDQNKNAATGRLILVDVENMVAKAQPSESEVAALRKKVEGSLRLTVDDKVIVGASASQNAFKFGHVWEGARLVYCKGKDGADNALIDAFFETDFSRYGDLILFSGDHAFANVIRTAKEHGKRVLISSGKSVMSRDLIEAGAERTLVAAV